MAVKIIINGAVALISSAMRISVLAAERQSKEKRRASAKIAILSAIVAWRGAAMAKNMAAGEKNGGAKYQQRVIGGGGKKRHQRKHRK